MPYLSAVQSPARTQWEASSVASQSYNCGPTSVAKVAQFYTDRWSGIEAGRKLIAGMGPYNLGGRWVYGAPPYTPTSAAQQRDILIARGVPCDVRRLDSRAQMKELVAGGRRPIIIGVYMARVPAHVRDHSFLEWHAMVVMDTAVVNGVPGFWVMDPNFSPPGGHRPDPDRGKKFYSESVMEYAYFDNLPRWAIVPTRAKAIAAQSEGLPVKFKSPGKPSWLRIKANTDVRATPSTSAGVIAHTGANGAGPYPLVGWTRGARYKTSATTTSNIWAIYRIRGKTTDPYDGRFGFLPRIYVKVTEA